MSICYQFLEPDSTFRPAEGLEKFRCLILIERHVSDTDRGTISRILVDAGCLFAMAWGTDCSLWDDSIDFANIDKFGPCGIPDDEFVMTTWHDEDTLDEVLYFAKFNSLVGYQGQQLKDLLVLDLGRENREAEVRQIYESLEVSSPSQLPPCSPSPSPL